VLQICTAVLVDDAVVEHWHNRDRDSQSMSNTAHAGVSHDAIRVLAAVVQLVRDAVPGYDWDSESDCHCILLPGHWLTYNMLVLLALPFPATGNFESSAPRPSPACLARWAQAPYQGGCASSRPQ
jgi:hypothetical protein